jgi:hypothetical protein
MKLFHGTVTADTTGDYIVTVLFDALWLSVAILFTVRVLVAVIRTHSHTQEVRRAKDYILFHAPDDGWFSIEDIARYGFSLGTVRKALLQLYHEQYLFIREIPDEQTSETDELEFDKPEVADFFKFMVRTDIHAKNNKSASLRA